MRCILCKMQTVSIFREDDMEETCCQVCQDKHGSNTFNKIYDKKEKLR